MFKKAFVVFTLTIVLMLFSGCVGTSFVAGQVARAGGSGYIQHNDISYDSIYVNSFGLSPLNEEIIDLSPSPQGSYYLHTPLAYISTTNENLDETQNTAENSIEVTPQDGMNDNPEDKATEDKAIERISEEVEFAGYIAITFDDGPHPTLTPILLDALYQRQAHATFFLLGQEVQRHPSIVQRIYNEGHSIGNHSFNHPHLPHLGRNSAYSQLSRTSNAIESIIGHSPSVMRPPYGAHNSMVLDLAREMDMSVILWSIDPKDWLHRDVRTVREHIISRAYPGSVILLHDIHQTSVQAAIEAIDILMAQGYVFVTVEELFNRGLSAGGVYNSARGLYNLPENQYTTTEYLYTLIDNPDAPIGDLHALAGDIYTPIEHEEYEEEQEEEEGQEEEDEELEKNEEERYE